jgi:signal transduction histidine kinase/CheY-like chemotaxis protein
MDAMPRLQAILRFADALERAVSTEDACRAALDCVEQAIGAHRPGLLLAEPDQVMRFKAWRGVSESYRAAVERHLPLRPGLPRSGPIAVPDVAASDLAPELREASLREGIGALAFVPLHAGGVLIGTLMLHHDAPHPYGEDELRDAQAMADPIAIALDRHQALERERASNAILTALAEHLPEAVGFFAATGRLRYVNARMTAFLERYSHTCATQPEGASPASDPAGLRCLHPGNRTPCTRERAFDDGTVIEQTCVPVFARDELLGHLVQLRDVTQRRQFETQMLYARKMESIGRLAGGVAHDFNNMLTAMIGYMDLVGVNLPQGSEERGYLAHALEAAEQASDLTRQLLAFSRRETVPPSPQDLNALLERLAPMIRRLVPENVELVASADASPSWVLADAGQLEQVVVNLVFNARDAMPNGGRLVLRTANLPAGGADAREMVALEVEDSGVGMDAETLQHAFEPFYTTRGPERGAGLGLAMVYGVVVQSGGRVEAQSAPGRGSVFRVLLPLTGAPEAAAETPLGPIAPARHGVVMLVEDDASVRGLVTVMLGRLGYDVLAAARAEEALQMFDHHAGSVDLLIADMVMPGMSGRDLAVRAQARCPHLRVLLMSGYAPAQREAHAPTGFAFLAKPFSIETLARRVRETLDEPVPGRMPDALV